METFRPRWRRPKVLSQIATLDLETDPFLRERDPVPFAAGFWDGSDFKHWWGPACVQQLIAYLKTRDAPLLIYAHNGGKFDYLYVLDEVLKSPRTFYIKTRLVAWQLGLHELRDSFAILPAALGKMGDKRPIDVKNKFEKEVREKYRFEIVEYMKRDCTLLHELVSAFVQEFGPKLTAAAAALAELKSRHPFARLTEATDAYIRGPYFHGARVQTMAPAGVYRDDWKYYDVNSMYANVMATKQHPVGKYFREGTRVTKDTCFLTIECMSKGAFGHFDERKEFQFPDQEEGQWDITIHEFNAAKRLGLIVGKYKVIRTIDFKRRTNFATFVNHFYGLRRAAKARGDEIFDTVYKVGILNSAYGKTGIDPRNFTETAVASPLGPWPIGHGWRQVEWSPLAYVFERPVDPEEGQLWRKYQNVAIAASITGGARAVLMEAIARADTPMYCDTDSLICKGLPEDMLSEETLGKWKLQAEGAELAIAGKKMYALRAATGELVDYAAKGVPYHSHLYPDLHGDQPLMSMAREQWRIISNIALGRTLWAKSDAPTIRRSGKMDYLIRAIKATSPVLYDAPGALWPLEGETLSDWDDSEEC